MAAKRDSKKVPRRPGKIHSRSQESVSDEEEMTMSCKCPECKKEVAEEGVKCEMCDNWYHSKCQGVSKALYAALQEEASDEEEQSGLHWYCKRCNRACVKLHKGITIISKEQEILEKRMVKVEKVIDEMENGNIPKAAMKEIERKIDEKLKAANENMNQSVKKVVTESVDAANKSVVKHLSEQERRKFNLMIFRVRESNSEEANDRIKYDTDKFNEIMDKDLGLGTNNSIHAITRIGKRIRGNDDTRPMRVTMKTVEDRKRVLDRIRELRSNKDDKIVDIFIQPDLSQDEREERKKLRAELISRREAGEKDLSIRRGRIWKQGSFRP